MNRAIIIAFILSACFTLRLPAQETPGPAAAAPADTLLSAAPPAQKEGFFKKNYPDPRRAGLLSLILPGTGQIYNKDWWKVPLVYGAVGGMVFVISYNTDLYQRFQTAYQLKLKGQKHEFSDTAIDNTQALRSLRDEYDKNRQLAYFGTFFVYLLNGLEAFVDAHLKTFDINEDLSLQLRPTLNVDPLTNQPSLGLGVRIPLYRPTPAPPPAARR